MNRIQASTKDIKEFVDLIYSNNGKPCERFGMSWASLSALEEVDPYLTVKKNDSSCQQKSA
ncbi:hypothetical protein QMU85_000839 [Photobacterium damselae]|nr:hypothetical protein [Photobacterium damselae]